MWAEWHGYEEVMWFLEKQCPFGITKKLQEVYTFFLMSWFCFSEKSSRLRFLRVLLLTE